MPSNFGGFLFFRQLREDGTVPPTQNRDKRTQALSDVSPYTAVPDGRQVVF
tara:strand:+ start:294 stop:446 length:153 start_codon:yes stop_codon:yes gene_type:complete